MRKRVKSRNVVSTEFGTLSTKLMRRGVRIHVATKTALHVGTPTTASSAFVDLDEDAVVRLIGRLEGYRIGRKAKR